MNNSEYWSIVYDESAGVILGIDDSEIETIVGPNWSGFFSSTETAPTHNLQGRDSAELDSPLLFCQYKLLRGNQEIERSLSNDVIGSRFLEFTIKSQSNPAASTLNGFSRRVCEEFDSVTTFSFAAFPDAAWTDEDRDASGYNPFKFLVKLVLLR